MELNLLPPVRGTSFVSCNDELLFDIHNIVLHCLSDGATQSYLGVSEMWQPTWCFFRLHRPPSWGRRIWHGNVWLEQQHALMPAGLLWLGGGMPFGSLCAVKGRTPSLKEQASGMPWVGTVWKQHQDGSKYVKTCLGHPQTEGGSRETVQMPFFMLSCLNKQKDLTSWQTSVSSHLLTCGAFIVNFVLNPGSLQVKELIQENQNSTNPPHLFTD